MSNAPAAPWPELPVAAWRETYDTLHLWSQIVGKIRLARTPWLNHSWHVALYVTARGLTTSPIPDGAGTFQIDLDFIDHALRVSTSDGAQRQFALAGQSVTSFHAAILAALAELGIHIAIDEMPSELPEPIRFSEDNQHASYDPQAVRRFLQILVNVDRVFKQFRTGFLGKASPVHFFWGSFDLAVTRFSGRRAIPAAFLTFLTTSPAKPIRTRRAAPASGPAAARSITPRSIPIPMPIPSLPAFAPPR